MNLKEILAWAREIDCNKVDPKKKHHAECYRGMLVDKIVRINELTEKINSYYSDIEEYTEQLKKINIYIPGSEPKTIEEPVNVSTDEEKKNSPLLPT